MKFLENLLKPLESFSDFLFDQGWIGYLGIAILIAGLIYIIIKLI